MIGVIGGIVGAIVDVVLLTRLESAAMSDASLRFCSMRVLLDVISSLSCDES